MKMCRIKGCNRKAVYSIKALCRKHYVDWWHHSHKKERSEYGRLYYTANKWKNRDERRASDKKYYVKNKDRIKIYNAKRYLKNKDKISKQHAAYRASHTKERAEYNRRYNADPKHKDHKRIYSNQYRKARRRVDENYRLALAIRRRLANAYRRYPKGSKCISAVKDLGCTMKFFVKYIESHWLPGMSHDNYGGLDGWDIDHTRPLASFDLTDPKQARKACHYTNLRPMWHKDNLKKSDEI